MLKILLGLALLLAGGGLAAWYWIASTADRKWASMERRLAELAAQARARDFRRPSRPGLVPGDAWDDYLEAIDLLSRDRAAGDLYDVWSDSVPPSKAEAVLDRNPRVLELIRRGAHRATARHPDLREEDFYTPRFEYLRMLLASCVTAAGRLAREGKTREAAEVLLDILQVGNDADRDVIHSSAGFTQELHRGAVPRLVALRLPAADLREIAGEIERLEADLYPCEADLRNHRLRLVTFPQKEFLIGAGYLRIQPTAWQARRFGFSTRLMLVDAFDRGEDLLRSTAGIDALPFARAEALAMELRARAEGSGNLALWLAFPEVLSFVYAHRENRARLRLLRAALHQMATGERLDLADPFGTTLRWSPPGQPLRIWSVGYYGRDDGGKEPEDIVLTVP